MCDARIAKCQKNYINQTERIVSIKQDPVQSCIWLSEKTAPYCITVHWRETIWAVQRKKDTVLVLAVVAVAVAVAVAALEVAGLARALAAAAPVFPASCFPPPVLGFSLPPSVSTPHRPSVLLFYSALFFTVLCCSKSVSSALLYISPISPLCPCFPWMCTVHWVCTVHWTPYALSQCHWPPWTLPGQAVTAVNVSTKIAHPWERPRANSEVLNDVIVTIG